MLVSKNLMALMELSARQTVAVHNQPLAQTRQRGGSIRFASLCPQRQIQSMDNQRFDSRFSLGSDYFGAVQQIFRQVNGRFHAGVHTALWAWCQSTPDEIELSTHLAVGGLPEGVSSTNLGGCEMSR